MILRTLSAVGKHTEKCAMCLEIYVHRTKAVEKGHSLMLQRIPELRKVERNTAVGHAARETHHLVNTVLI